MHNLESIINSEMHKILWNIEIQTDHPISARRPGLMNINKKMKKGNLLNCGFSLSARLQSKNFKNAKREVSTKTWLENENSMEHEGDSDTNCNW